MNKDFLITGERAYTPVWFGVSRFITEEEIKLVEDLTVQAVARLRIRI